MWYERMRVSEYVFACVTLVVPFLSGMFFFSKWLFRDVEVRWGIGFVSQVIFSATLAVCFQTHIVVLGEVSGILTRQTRADLWNFDFTLLIVLLKVVIPFLAFYAFISRRQTGGHIVLKLFMTIVIECVWLFITSWGQNGPSLDLQKETERLGIVGLASVAILSGWGAVHGPYSYGPWFIKSYDDEEIAQLQNKIWSVMEMRSSLKRRQCIMNDRQRTVLSPLHGNKDYSSSKISFFENVWNRKSNPLSSSSNGDTHNLEETLREESIQVESLSLLSTELFLELTEMKRAKQANIFRKTFLGRIYTILGYTFAVYCVLKMIASIYGMVFPKKHDDPDLITRVLSFVLLLARDREEANFLAQTISFTMVGVLVFNSFRGLLVTLGKIFHQVGPRDSSLVALLLTEIMGQYLLSSIIMLDMNLPVRYRGELFYKKFEFFRVWSDALFLLAGIASAVLIYAQDKAQGSRTEFYHTTMHEKLI